MSDRPILMSAPMVRALLREIEQPGSGKTQTRRLAWLEAWRTGTLSQPASYGVPVKSRKPTIWQSVKPGDRLYVQEELRQWGRWVAYEAGGYEEGTLVSGHLWRQTWTRNRQPARFCPRAFSRITLLVTATKVEWVQEISEADARAEGAVPVTREDANGPVAWNYDPANGSVALSGVTAMVAYQRLWRSLHTKPGARWEDNPEVVAITFRPVLANIDQVAEAV